MKTVEGPLNTLGNILIALGWVAGILFIIMSFIESEGWFYFLLSLTAVLSGYLSGYLFKGISNIISLLSSISIIPKRKQSSSSSNFDTNKSDSRSWSEISDSMKKK
jgi:hypothetical protein